MAATEGGRLQAAGCRDQATEAAPPHAARGHGPGAISSGGHEAHGSSSGGDLGGGGNGSHPGAQLLRASGPAGWEGPAARGQGPEGWGSDEADLSTGTPAHPMACAGSAAAATPATGAGGCLTATAPSCLSALSAACQGGEGAPSQGPDPGARGQALGADCQGGGRGGGSPGQIPPGRFGQIPHGASGSSFVDAANAFHRRHGLRQQK